MDNYGVILKKLRLLNRLTIKEAAKKIGKSTGWICEAENAKGHDLGNAIDGVLYVCADQTITSLLAKAEEEIRKDRSSILYFASLDDALAGNEKITLRNAKGGNFILR